MILVDSSVWIDYFNGRRTSQSDRLDNLLGVEFVAVGDLILAEVLQGFAHDGDFHRAASLLTSLTVIELGGIEIGLQAARNYRALRKRGVTIRKTIDAIIATRCIEDGHSLLHNDRDFDPFVRYLGLKTVD